MEERRVARALVLQGFAAQAFLVSGVRGFPQSFFHEVAEGPQQARRSEARCNRGPEFLHEGLLKHGNA